MRKSKKILAVTLAAAMLCSVLPASQANAAVKHKGVYSTLKMEFLQLAEKVKCQKT